MTDPREELAALTGALRAYVERCQATGATGLPRASAADLAARPEAVPAPEGSGEPLSAPRSSGAQAAVPAAPPRSSGAAVPAAAHHSSGAAVHAAPPRSSGAAVPAAVRPPELDAKIPVVGAPPGAHEIGGPPAGGHARLRVLSSEVAACTGCGLHAGRMQTVFARGTGSSGLCFVGEGPGAEEDEQGLPFVGKAGQLLDKMIEAMGIARDDVYVCNIVKCRPPKNRKPEPDEVAACRPYLMEQLELVEPKVIVALGATAVEGLLGLTGGITRLRGTWRLYRGRIAVMPTFHPAYLLRNPAAKREVWSDLQLVMEHLGRPLPRK